MRMLRYLTEESLLFRWVIILGWSLWLVKPQRRTDFAVLKPGERSQVARFYRGHLLTIQLLQLQTTFPPYSNPRHLLDVINRSQEFCASLTKKGTKPSAVIARCVPTFQLPPLLHFRWQHYFFSPPKRKIFNRYYQVSYNTNYILIILT